MKRSAPNGILLSLLTSMPFAKQLEQRNEDFRGINDTKGNLSRTKKDFLLYFPNLHEN
jgi:hypothetical protein